MAEKKIRYPNGKNPNSLANLEKGRAYRNKLLASQAGKKSAEVRKARKTMKEVAENLTQEETTIKLKDGTEVVMTKLEIILANYIKECAQNPTHKNVLALRSLLGEDIQHIETNVSIQGKYDNISITKEMIAKAEAIMDAKANMDD